jgi:hypothetical protein
MAAAVLGTLLATIAAVPTARAGLLVPTASGCEPASPARVFLRWLDVANYVPVRDGGLEAGGAGWDLDGASVVAANEPWRVGAGGDARALALGPGTAATTPSICVGLEYPTIRFFARRTGETGGLLAVQAIADTSLGRRLVLPIGVVAGLTGSWTPTLPMAMVANNLALAPGERTRMSFRFVPVGSGSAWQVDDVYVDPYSKR